MSVVLCYCSSSSSECLYSLLDLCEVLGIFVFLVCYQSGIRARLKISRILEVSSSFVYNDFKQ